MQSILHFMFGAASVMGAFATLLLMVSSAKAGQADVAAGAGVVLGFAVANAVLHFYAFFRLPS